MLFAFAACGEDATTDETTTTTAADVAEEITEAVDPAQTEESLPADATTAVDASAESTEAASAAYESTTAAETTAAVAAAPTTTAEIITLYNNAVNSAYNAKAGFEKERSADNENLKTSGALGAFKDLVYQFMGIGAENKYYRWLFESVPPDELEKLTELLTAIGQKALSESKNGFKNTLSEEDTVL